MRENPLLEEYKDALNSKASFRLIIVGKDPYPTDAIGIPFCKPDWHKMRDKRICGLSVLQSLGLDIEKESDNFKTPKELFIHLVKEKGIAFLNRSYRYLGGPVSRKHFSLLEDAEKINKSYLQKSENTVLCGVWQEKLWCRMGYDKLNYAIHPDNRNRKRATWSDWWSKGVLKKRFGL